MKQALIRFTSVLVVSTLIFSWAPGFFHHQHEEINHCEHSEGFNEINSCHISLFHSEEAGDIACEHNAHFSKDEDDCQWCSLLTPKRQKYKLPKVVSYGLDHSVIFLEETPIELSVQNAVSLKPSRGPPFIV